MGENHFASWPVALYGIILLAAAIAYYILVRTLLKLNGPDSLLGRALGSGFKEKISLSAYVVAIPLAFVRPWAACSLYVLVALSWFVPDRRIERKIEG